MDILFMGGRRWRDRRDTPWDIRWWDTIEVADTELGVLSDQSGRSQYTILILLERKVKS